MVDRIIQDGEAAPVESPQIMPASAESWSTGRRGSPGTDAAETSLSSTGHPRRFLIALLVAGAALMLLVAAFNLVTDTTGLFGIGLFPPRVAQDRTLKADRLAALPAAPELLIFGSSRGWQAEASYVQGLTGRRTFNAAVTAGRASDAYVFTRLNRDLWPGTRPDYLWLLDVEAFQRGALAPSVLADARFRRYLPVRTRAEEMLGQADRLFSWRGLRESLSVWRTHPSWEKIEAGWRQRMAADGTVTAKADAEARVTPEKLSVWSAAARRRYRQFDSLSPDEQRYLEQTLALFASWGGDGVIVLTPTQPQVLAALKEGDWQQRHDDVLALLERLGRRYHFTVVDLSSIESFGGSPEGFFDPFHMTRSNQRRMIEAALAAE